jgi:CDP-diacylglycerol--glycerol-3-phosphate 3-phosphatidyltransferase
MVLGGIGTASIAGVAAVLICLQGLPTAARWGIPAAVVWGWVFLRMGKGLALNHPPGDLRLRASIGAANFLTLSRSALTAALAGFLFQSPADGPQPSGDWLPGLLYLSAAVMDGIDGWLARTTRSVTRLGELLDTEVDALGLLVVSLLLVSNAKAPLAYAGVGIGYYLLRAAIGLRRAAGRPIGRIAPRVTARWVAGCEMGFAAAALLPVFGPEATRPAAGVMTLAMGISLAQDWLIVCGYAAQDGRLVAGRLQPLGRALARALPLMLRAVVAVGLVLSFSPSPALGILAAASAALCALGVAARAVAMLISLLCAAWLIPSIPGSGPSLILMAALGLMLTGAGHPRLWQPEERFLMRPQGEERAADGAGHSAGRASGRHAGSSERGLTK